MFISDSLEIKNNYLRKLNSMPKPEEQKFEFNAVSMFSGGGGIDLGITWAGFDVCYSSDIEPQLTETVRFNFPNTFVENKDIRDLTGSEILFKSNLKSVDLIIGGPPCQAFSILGRRNSFGDPRGQLVFEYARIISELKPKAFLFENVPGILNVNKGKDWNEFMNFIKENTKYKIFSNVLNAADYGVPQIRKRVFVIGFLDEDIEFSFPNTLYSNDKDIFSNNGEITKSWVKSKLALEGVENLPNHKIRIHGERVGNRYLRVPQGERDRTDRTDRIHPERPSGTVLVGSKAGGGRPFIHPYEPRHITVREAARLQSFPDWYEIKSTDTWQYRAIGNAVPPLLAYQIGLQIKKALTK